jgi:hypothetical protein
MADALWVWEKEQTLRVGSFSFFCSVSYTKNYTAGTGIRQDEKMSWNVAGL